MRNLTGKVAIVTGSTKGIGLAIAQHLSRSGASVVVNGRSADDVRGVAAGLEGSALGIAAANDPTMGLLSPQALAAATAMSSSSGMGAGAGAGAESNFYFAGGAGSSGAASLAAAQAAIEAAAQKPVRRKARK